MNFLLLFLLTVFGPDSILSHEISSGLRSPLSDALFKGLTETAEGEVLTSALLLYGALGGEESWKDVRAVTSAALASAGLVYLLKYTTGRKRPGGASPRSNSSFPSGHTTGAFLISSYFSSRYRKLTVPLYLWAAGVGLSRIYLQKHWPTDVLVGAIIGITSGLIAYKYRDRLGAFQLYP